MKSIRNGFAKIGKKKLLPVLDTFNLLEMFIKKRCVSVHGMIISVLWSLHLRNKRTDVR